MLMLIIVNINVDRQMITINHCALNKKPLEILLLHHQQSDCSKEQVPTHFVA